MSHLTRSNRSRTATVAVAAAALLAVALPGAASAGSHAPPKRAGAVPKVAPPAKTKRKIVARSAAYGAGSVITGNCNGNSLLQLGTWNAVGLVNSTFADGDTYYFKFHLYDRARAAFVASTGWSTGRRVVQAPSRTLVFNFFGTRPVFNIVRQRWYAVYLETWSHKLGRVMLRAWVPMQTVGGDLSSVWGTYYCKSF